MKFPQNLKLLFYSYVYYENDSSIHFCDSMTSHKYHIYRAYIIYDYLILLYVQMSVQMIISISLSSWGVWAVFTFKRLILGMYSHMYYLITFLIKLLIAARE